MSSAPDPRPANAEEESQPQAPTPPAQEPPAATASPRRRDLRALLPDLRLAAAIVLGCALLGLALGAVWCAIAPRVALYADTSAVYLKFPEGEESAATDGWFAVLGAIAGLLTGALAYWLTRRRDGGAAVPVALVIGGLVGGIVAWRLGVALGPEQNIVAHAKSVPVGHVFDAPLALNAKAALLTWPFVACLAVLLATLAFTPREPDAAPQPDWTAAQQSQAQPRPQAPEQAEQAQQAQEPQQTQEPEQPRRPE
ncbi:GlsB/YeaQ/YmgE family stress response membrane protein [Phaeacidiphilus oryzae]|uniref:GlsB/YeaQ/YmgE family stress response membrane protein n=1 Tax=Phaeacidiphilus oryzae TaxID=348818 RepID=UPI0007C67704|nr:hypothetical protein [Phaeacidiphilus oryzae]